MLLTLLFLVRSQGFQPSWQQLSAEKKTKKHLYKMRGWMEGEIKGRYLNCVCDYGPSSDQWRAQHSARKHPPGLAPHVFLLLF